MSFDVTKQGGVLQQTMTTFSGCDIKAYFENLEIGNLQGISLSVNREVRPVFVMGNPDVLSYSRGKRGVAGSLIMTVFDRDALYEVKRQANYAAKVTDLSREDSENGGLSGIATATNVGTKIASPRYSDQIPPFVYRIAA